MNKSEAIREYAREHPGLGLTQISKALSAKGVSVSPAHVSQALRSAGLYTKAKSRRRTAKGAVKPERAEKKPSGVVEAVSAAKMLVKECGSVDVAIQLLKAVC